MYRNLRYICRKNIRQDENQDMKPAIIRRLHKIFEDFVHVQDGVEFWFARDLQELLGYDEWRNFLRVIEKAKESCETSGNTVPDHFVDANKMVTLGSDAKREIEDLLLTRYACYLIAQNGDPRKEEIAFAQSYFAVQTRKQEIIEDHIQLAERLKARKHLKDSEKELSRNIYERGVDESGFARIRSKGDMALFGGHTTAAMKNRLEIPENRPLADFLPTVTITAKNLATEITNFNVTKEDLQGEDPITDEHVQNNQDVRELLLKRGIRPETLPPEEDLIKLERRVKSQEKKIAGRAGKISSELRDGKQ
jgi:DNA-damage-inducible protein D